jgi:hypothetical protein
VRWALLIEKIAQVNKFLLAIQDKKSVANRLAFAILV